jgi:DHA3 family macrolide efflux protein-like MFS transporter
MLVSPLGLVIAGPVADALGIQLWFWVTGITCGTMGIAGFFLNNVMRMEEQKKETAEEHS